MQTLNKDEKLLKRLEVEHFGEWAKWSRTIPFVSFPEDWEIQILPPYGNLIVRYNVRLKCNPHKTILVVLDSRDFISAGEDHPAWEIYHSEEDFDKNKAYKRCEINNTTRLIAAIDKIFKS